MSWARLAILAVICAAAIVGPLERGALNAQETKNISLHLSNEVVPLTSNATTVSGLLEELSIQLPAGASVDPPLSSALTEGMSVYLNSLSVTRGEAEEPLPASVQIEESWRFGPETIELLDPGCDGLAHTTCTIFFSDGQEVGRRERREVVREMQPQLVVVYHALTGADGPTVEQILALRAAPGAQHEPPAHYKRTVTMESTAYEPGPTSCGGDTSGNTAIGLQAGYGVVAVDPDVIKLGTRLFIESYGYAVAGDTGGAIKGNRIDLGFKTLDECYAWGRRDVKVYVLY